MTDSQRKEIISIEGDKGASLFYRPLIDVIDQDRFGIIQGIIDDDFQKLDKLYDDRAFAIVGALCIENALDKFLSTWLVNYKKYLRDNKDFTFSSKVDLAKSTRLVPMRIFNSIDPIRRIRNIFAHHLEIDSFKKAKEIRPGPFQSLYDKIKTFVEWNKQEDRETFKNLVIFIVLAIEVYTKHVEKVRNYIWTPEKLSEIIKAV